MKRLYRLSTGSSDSSMEVTCALRGPSASWRFSSSKATGVANGVDFHVAVPEVLYVSADAELRSPAIRKIAKPNALHAARDRRTS